MRASIRAGSGPRLSGAGMEKLRPGRSARRASSPRKGSAGSRRLLVLDPLRLLARADGLRRLDLDATRPQLLRHLARELDRQQPVLEARPLHLDVVGELEPALERAGRDAAVEVLRVTVGLLLPAHH